MVLDMRFLLYHILISVINMLTSYSGTSFKTVVYKVLVDAGCLAPISSTVFLHIQSFMIMME